MSTEHDQLLSRLRRERDDADRYFDMAGVLMLVLDREGRVERLNRRGAEILGCTSAWAKGKNWFSTFVPVRMRDDVRRVFGRMMGGRAEGAEYYDNPVLTATGNERMVRWHNTVLLDEAGRPRGTLSSGMDVTDELRRDRELRDSEQRFRSLYSSVQAGVVVLAASGEILHANRTAAEILGMEVDGITGRSTVDPVWQMVDEEGRPLPGEQHPSMATLRTGESLRNQVRGLFAGDPARTRWLLINTEPLAEAAKGGVIVTFLDITQLRRGQEQLRLSEQQVRESREELRQLAAHVEAAREAERKEVAREIHDQLGQLLTALRMDLVLVARDAGVLNAAARARLAGMTCLVDEAACAVKRISTALRPGALDDLGLTAACEWLCAETRARTGLRCSFQADIDEGRLDEQRRLALYRILQESLTNVVHHAHATRATVRLTSRGGEVTLRVGDNGTGIDADSLTSAESLGLIGMRERAANLGGELHVERGRSGGTVVRAVVPLPSNTGAVPGPTDRRRRPRKGVRRSGRRKGRP